MITKRFIQFLIGPWMLLPQAFLVSHFVGLNYYVPPEMTGNLQKDLFLQGSTDLGGGCLFAGTMALYVVFGFTSAWYLVLKLQGLPVDIGFRQTFVRSIWILKFHIPLFIIGGTMNIGYDSRVAENDFRNMFLFATALYTFTVVFICLLHQTQMAMRVKLMIAPMFTILWLIAGSDGNTARAGQLVQSGQDPQPNVRGIRHQIMMTWHSICDRTLGDIHE